MSGRRLTLIARDRPLAHAVQDHLHEALGEPVLLCEFAGLRDQLAKDAPGLLLLAADTADEFAEGLRVAQESAPPTGPPSIRPRTADTLSGAFGWPPPSEKRPRTGTRPGRKTAAFESRTPFPLLSKKPETPTPLAWLRRKLGWRP